MTSQPNRHTRLWSAAGSAFAVLCVATACEAPRPGAITPPETPEATKIAEAEWGTVPVSQVPTYRPQIENVQDVLRMMEDGYPKSYRDRKARVVVRFAIGTNGVPEGVHVIQGAEIPEFDSVALQTMREARFNPPPVRVTATMPVEFFPRTQRDTPATTLRVGDYEVFSVTGKSRRTPDTPEMARMRELARKHTGEDGQATLSIEPDGSVSDVHIAQSTGDKVMDEAFVTAFRTHRFPAGDRAHTITVPMVPHPAKP